MEVGALSRGKSIDLPVAEGPHELEVRIDWTGSPPVRFEVTEGSCTRFVVASSKKAGAAALAPENWLTITPDSAEHLHPQAPALALYPNRCPAHPRPGLHSFAVWGDGQATFLA